MEPQILLFHYSEAVLLARVLPLFDEVEQFLVQPLIEQLEIAFPEPILSSADVVQRIIDFVYAQRLPSVLLEDSVLYVNRVLARLVFILLMSLPFPSKLLPDSTLLSEGVQVPSASPVLAS